VKVVAEDVMPFALPIATDSLKGLQNIETNEEGKTKVEGTGPKEPEGPTDPAHEKEERKKALLEEKDRQLREEIEIEAVSNSSSAPILHFLLCELLITPQSRIESVRSRIENILQSKYNYKSYFCSTDAKLNPTIEKRELDLLPLKSLYSYLLPTDILGISVIDTVVKFTIQLTKEVRKL
jgi:hypothetical protein